MTEFAKCPECGAPVVPALHLNLEPGWRYDVRGTTAHKRLVRIAEIIEGVDHRAMAADGPVTPTLTEMTQAEMSEIYELAVPALLVDQQPQPKRPDQPREAGGPQAEG